MKPKLRALTASLFLAATSGSAGAVIRTSDNGALFLTTVSPGNVVSYTGDIGVAMDRLLSGRAELYANPTADPLRNTANRTALPDSNETASAGRSIRAITTIGPGTSAAKFNVTPNGRPSASTAPPPESNVPEPNNWAILLAGLLGAGAIARRRMSS